MAEAPKNEMKPIAIRWTSRKLWMAGGVVALSLLVPVIYAKLGIDTNITQHVLLVIGSVGGLYLGANVLSARLK